MVYYGPHLGREDPLEAVVKNEICGLVVTPQHALQPYGGLGSRHGALQTTGRPDMPEAAAQLAKAQHCQRTTMLRPSLVITAMVAAARRTQQRQKPAGTSITSGTAEACGDSADSLSMMSASPVSALLAIELRQTALEALRGALQCKARAVLPRFSKLGAAPLHLMMPAGTRGACLRNATTTRDQIF